MGWRLIEEEKSLGARGGGAAILSDREQLWKCWALFLLFREEQPEPKQAFAAAVSGQPNSESPAAVLRLHRPPGGGGHARGCPMCGHLCTNSGGRRGSRSLRCLW